MLFSVDTTVRGRFSEKRCGPSRRCARNASAALENFVCYPQKTFSTASVKTGKAQCEHMVSALPLPAQPVDATLYLKGEMECALMGQRFHRGFTAAEKTELWDRWQRGESLKAIGRAFGKPSSSIYFLVAPHGGIRPARRRRSRLAFTLAER